MMEDRFGDGVKRMASFHVLIKENGTYRFFHEGFFDYAFARTFVNRGGKLLDLLLKGGQQHLFRRAQVRQILTYLRSRPQGLPYYLEQLDLLLKHRKVRSHIKRVIFDWMRALPDPHPEEAILLKFDEL